MREWYPAVTDEELERISSFVGSYCSSELAVRIAALEDVGRSGRSRSSTTASFCTVDSTRCGVTVRERWSSTTRRTRWPKVRPTRSSRPTTGCSGSSTPLRASGREPTRWRSCTSSSSGRTRWSRPRSSGGSCLCSSPSCRRRSGASTAGSSCRHRASSPARGVRRSTSSARDRASAEEAGRRLPPSLSMA